MTVHVTIELDETQDAELRALAQRQKVSPEDLIKQVLQERLSEDLRFVEAVQRGMADIAAGRYITHEEALTRSKRRREELLAGRSTARRNA